MSAAAGPGALRLSPEKGTAAVEGVRADAAGGPLDDASVRSWAVLGSESPKLPEIIELGLRILGTEAHSRQPVDSLLKQILSGAVKVRGGAAADGGAVGSAAGGGSGGAGGGGGGGGRGAAAAAAAAAAGAGISNTGSGGKDTPDAIRAANLLPAPFTPGTSSVFASGAAGAAAIDDGGDRGSVPSRSRSVPSRVLQPLLLRFVTKEDGWNCSYCEAVFPAGTTMFGCRITNVDCCGPCYAAAEEEHEEEEHDGRRSDEEQQRHLSQDVRPGHGREDGQPIADHKQNVYSFGYSSGSTWSEETATTTTEDNDDDVAYIQSLSSSEAESVSSRESEPGRRVADIDMDVDSDDPLENGPAFEGAGIEAMWDAEAQATATAAATAAEAQVVVAAAEAQAVEVAKTQAAVAASVAEAQSVAAAEVQAVVDAAAELATQLDRTKHALAEERELAAALHAENTQLAAAVAAFDASLLDQTTSAAKLGARHDQQQEIAQRRDAELIQCRAELAHRNAEIRQLVSAAHEADQTLAVSRNISTTLEQALALERGLRVEGVSELRLSESAHSKMRSKYLALETETKNALEQERGRRMESLQRFQVGTRRCYYMYAGVGA